VQIHPKIFSKNLSGDLHGLAEFRLVRVMREQIYQFKGRGQGTGHQDDPYRLIRCTEGTVMVITVTCHGIEFIKGYCRKAMIDRWGVHCEDPFLRASDAGLTHSWAQPVKRGRFIFSPIKLEIVSEQEWMRHSC